jgi:Chaperone of endosialidase
MKKLFLSLCLLLAISAARAQSVGIGTNNPSGIFHVTNNPSGSSALFYVHSNGNVGVGTINPQSKLEVAGGLLARNATITATSAGTDPLQVESYFSLVDQQQNSGNKIYGTSSFGWQSFTAGVTGILDSVVLSFHSDFTPILTILRIYAGEGQDDSILVSKVIVPVPGSSTTSPYLNVAVIAGNKYTIWLNHQAGWMYSPSNVYSGGSADPVLDGGDRLFKTYVSSLVSLLKVDNDGNVGIGTENPSEKLVVKTTTGNYGLIHTNGSIILGTYVGGTSSYGGWIGTKSNHPLMFFTNNGGAQMALMQNGNIGIGTVYPNYKLQVSGVAAANDFVNMSDARLKKDIVPLSGALSKILQLNGVAYYWKGEAYPQYQFDTKHKIGFLAQEVEKVMPELVAVGADGYKTVNYIEVVPLLVESIKEQQQQINELKQLVKKLLKSNL